MKPWRIIGPVVLLSLIAGLAWVFWKNGGTRREATDVLHRFADTVQSADGPGLLALVSLPGTLQSRTPAEQVEFLSKALRGEISPEGIAALKREATFGPLTNLFPAEAEAGAKQAGVAPENCVAFRMEKNGLRAEVVLLSSQSGYRIIRCNNVKQMAEKL